MKKRYENLNGVKNEHGFRDMWKWLKERREKSKDLSENIPKGSQGMSVMLPSIGRKPP